jgi:hypothetical protein
MYVIVTMHHFIVGLMSVGMFACSYIKILSEHVKYTLF